VLALVEAREKARKLLDWIINYAVKGTFSSEEKEFLRDKCIEDVLTSAIQHFDKHGFVSPAKAVFAKSDSPAPTSVIRRI